MLRQIKNFDLDKIAESGQCFRLDRQCDGSFSLIAHGRILKMKRNSGQSVEFSCSEKEFSEYWNDYFDLPFDYDIVESMIPLDDSFLIAAAKFSEGMRILNQDPWETLISFIISQRKSIPAIKTSIEKLSLAFGNEIEPGYHAFPSSEKIADASLQELKDCSLGYRADYISKTAKIVAEHPKLLSELSCLSSQDLVRSLMKFPGVGEKVSNCVSLFAYGRKESFPRDVWINRIIDNVYGGVFDEKRFGKYSGIVQQYMFFYARTHPESLKKEISTRS